MLPPLHEEEFKTLKDSIIIDGLQDAIKVWIDPIDNTCYLVDGHNRYAIMERCGRVIPHDKITTLDSDKYKTKDDVIFYMLQYQLGRRNLNDAQRIEITDKFRPLIEKRAKQNQSAGGGYKKSGLPDLGKPIPKIKKVDTNDQMAKMARMSKEKYRQGKVVLNSDNEELKQRYRNNEISTYKAYKKVTGVAKDKKNIVPQFKTVADCDKEIADVDSKILSLYELKAKLIQERNKAFQVDKQELKCEYIAEHSITWSRYYFYLIKGEARVDLFSLFNDSFQCIDILIEKIEQGLKHYGWKEKSLKLTKDEQAFIKAKIIDIRDIVEKDEELRKQAKKEQDNRLFEAVQKAFGGTQQLYSERIKNLTDQQRVCLKMIFKDADKKYHPDANLDKDTTEIMQIINQLKEIFGI